MLHLGGPPLKGAPRASGLWQPSPTAVRVSLNNGAVGGGQDFRPQAVRLQEPCDELVVEAVGSTSKLVVSAEAGCSTTPSSAAVHHDVNRWVEPGQLTRRIVESQSIYELHDLVTQHELNSIHVSAALVKLARLIKEGQHSQDSVTDASEHHLTDRRGSHTYASTSSSALGSQTRPRSGNTRQRHLPSNILASVHAMAMDLCSQYMAYVKQYTIARQHANVAWALAQLHQQAHLPVPLGVLDALSTALLHNKAYKLYNTAMPQELANLALALAKLHYSYGPLVVAIASAAQDNLLRFKPQELSNLSWGLSQAYTTLTASQHASLGMTTAFVLRDQPSPLDTAYPQLLSLQDRIASRASQIAWQFQPCELVSVLWSAAHAGRATRHTSSLFEAALPVLQQHARMRLLNGQDIGNSVWAYAKLGYVNWGLALLESLMATGDQHQQPQQQHWRHSRSQGKSADAMATMQESVRRQRPQATRQGASLYADGEAPGAWVARRCNGQELVNLMWACAVLGARPRPAAAPWTPSATAAAHQLASSILSHLVGTSSNSNGNGNSSDAHAHDMTPQGLANVAWAAARLALPDVPARVFILHKAAAQAESMSSTELSNVLWSLTSLPPWVCLDPSNRAAMTALLSALRQQIPSCQPAGIAQVAWALGWAAQACHFNPSPSDTTPHSAVPGDADGAGLLHASSQDGPQVMPLGAEQDARAWFMAHWQPLLRAVGQHAAQGLGTFCHQDLCVLAQGLSYAYQHHPQQLLSQYTSRQQSQPQPHQDDSEHNGNSSSSSTAGLSTGAALDPEPLFRAIGDAAVALLQQTTTAGGFSPGGLVGLLAAFTRVRAPHRELSACAARVAAARPELYSPVQLANLMWALASARVRDRQLLDRVAGMLLAGPLRDLPTQSSTFGSYGYGYGYPAAGPFLQHTSFDQPQQRRHHAPLASAVVGVEVDKDFGNEFLDTGEKHVQGRGEALTEEEEEGPRGNASSLLRQLGWEDEDEDVDDHHQNGQPQPGVTGGKRRHASGCQGARAGPWEGEEDLTNAAASQGQPMQARRSQRRSSSNGMHADHPQQHPQQQDHRDHQRDWQQQLYAEPACSSPAMVWTVLTWAFARSNYHQHELYERLAAAVLTGGVMMSTGMQGTSSTDFSSPPSPRRALAQLTTPCLVQLLWALAAHDHPHPLLLREASPVLAARIRRGHMRPRDVATVTWAYARLQQYEPVLFNAVLRETQTHSARYNLRMWSRLTWAFSTLCLPSEEAFFLRLAQLQRQDAAAAARRQQQQQQKQQHQPRTVSPSPALSQSSSPQSQPCNSSPSPPHAVNSHSSGWSDTNDSSGLSWAWAPTSVSSSPSHTVMTAMGVGTWTDVTAHDAAAAEQEWLSSSPGMPYRSAHDMINEPTAGGAWVGAIGGDVQLVAKPMRKTQGLNGSSATEADSNSQQQAAGIMDAVQQ